MRMLDSAKMEPNEFGLEFPFQWKAVCHMAYCSILNHAFQISAIVQHLEFSYWLQLLHHASSVAPALLFDSTRMVLFSIWSIYPTSTGHPIC